MPLEMDLSSTDPIELKIQIGKQLYTFKVIVTDLDIHTNNNATPIWDDPNTPPRYLPGRTTKNIKIEGLITEEATIIETPNASPETGKAYRKLLL